MSLLLSSVFLLLFAAKYHETLECGINPTSCSPESIKYRSNDGTCNNLKNPGMGSKEKPYTRFVLPPNYSDGVSKKPLSASGNPLPSARLISEQSAAEIPEVHAEIVRIISGWMQFVAHDHSFTKEKQSEGPCCTNDLKDLPVTPLSCGNIKIPANDSFYSQFEATCMPQTRTATTLDLNCTGSKKNTFADQISLVTPALDLSTVYSNSKNEADGLRTFEGGFLKSRNVSNAEFLPNRTGCAIPSNTPKVCYATGDVRANQNFDLTLHHIMAVRFHNWCCRVMKGINPHWNDERMFQECRKINIAVYQHLTYQEAFAKIIGEKNMRNKNLLYPYNFFNTRSTYNDSCELNPINEFSNGAFRVLHAILITCMKLANENRNNLGELKMIDHLNNPSQIEKNDTFDNLLRGGSCQRARKVGPSHDSHITTRFTFGLTRFNFALDLLSLDIERSRDHGIPPYNAMREKCGLKKATSFKDLLDVMKPERVARLEELYEDVDDIDYLAGGMNECPVPGAMVGPTVACVMLESFKRIKECDRFYHDNNQNNHNDAQLAEIRKMTTSKYYCLTGNAIKSMQYNAFEPPSTLNPIMPCSYFKSMSLLAWKESEPIYG